MEQLVVAWKLEDLIPALWISALNGCQVLSSSSSTHWLTASMSCSPLLDVFDNCIHTSLTSHPFTLLLIFRLTISKFSRIRRWLQFFIFVNTLAFSKFSLWSSWQFYSENAGTILFIRAFRWCPFILTPLLFPDCPTAALAILTWHHVNSLILKLLLFRKSFSTSGRETANHWMEKKLSKTYLLYKYANPERRC